MARIKFDVIYYNTHSQSFVVDNQEILEEPNEGMMIEMFEDSLIDNRSKSKLYLLKFGYSKLGIMGARFIYRKKNEIYFHGTYIDQPDGDVIGRLEWLK